jgi:hypothetical protein
LIVRVCPPFLFIEEKTILADLSTAQHIKTQLQNVQGTLFVKNNVFDDLILEVPNEST